MRRHGRLPPNPARLRHQSSEPLFYIAAPSLTARSSALIIKPCDTHRPSRRHSCQRHHARCGRSACDCRSGLPDRGQHARLSVDRGQLFDLCSHAGARLPLLYALSLAGADESASCVSCARSRGHLFAYRWNLHTLHAGIASWTGGLDSVWDCLGTRYRRHHLQELRRRDVSRWPQRLFIFSRDGLWSSRLARYCMRSALMACSWLGAGGLAYTFGIVFFALDRIRYFHAAWHLFVLAGSVAHYFAILFYVVPPA